MSVLKGKWCALTWPCKGPSSKLGYLNHTQGYDLNLAIVIGKRGKICEKKFSATLNFACCS